MKRFTEEHEWVFVENGIATIGISHYAATELGDITFVELPELGAEFAQSDSLTTIESVKAASDIYAPISGTVCEVNEALNEHPEIINASPEEDGWICKLETIGEEELDRLLTDEEYEEFIRNTGH